MSLVVDQVEFSYPNKQKNGSDRVFSWNIHVPTHHIISLTGPSGSGKSSLLHVIAGLKTPHGGEIFWNDKNITHVPAHLRPIDYLFQQNNLFAHLTLYQNVALGIKTNLQLDEAEKNRINDLIDLFDLKSCSHHHPHEASVGQQQRASLARCFLRNRSLLLLDEPFSALDPALRFDLIDFIRREHQKNPRTMIIANHHPDEIAPWCHNEIRLDETNELSATHKHVTIQP